MTVDVIAGGAEPSDATEAPARPTGGITGYQPGFDGIKALALFAILAYHSQTTWVRGAFLGLSQFFTLSGFLITTILLRADARGGIGLKAFWTRRFRRLMPAALACLVLVVVYGATAADHQQATALPLQVTAAATYWLNWLFIVKKTSYVGLFASPSPVQHFWSLSVEEQFYLVMPVGVLLLLRRWRSPVVLGAVFGGGALLSTAWMAWLYHHGSGVDRIYYGSDTRVAEMLVGALLAVVLFHRPELVERGRRIIGPLAVVALAVTAWAMFDISLAAGPIWSGGLLAFSGLSVILMLAVLGGQGVVARLLSLPPLPAIGRMTYGLYLYHWPIFLWLTAGRTGLSAWPLFAVRIALTFGAAGASYLWLERPIRDGSSFGLSGSLRFAVAPLAVLLIAVGAYATVNRDAPDPLATLRADDSSHTPPVVAPGGVLDLLVITDEAPGGVVDRIARIGRHDHTVRTTRSPFTCSGITVGANGPVCANWAAQWPALVRRSHPEVVLLYVDQWSSADLSRLSNLPAPYLPAFAQKVLGNGFDLLTAGGARIVFASSGASFAVNYGRSVQPFFKAMATLETTRDDVSHVLGDRLPDRAAVPRATFVQQSAEDLITDASLYQRSRTGNLPKVLILGDSQAVSLGYGLQRWAAQDHRALVWNAGTEGCGMLDGGALKTGSVPSTCTDAVDSWAEKVDSFRPDVVVVLSSLWDLQDRRLIGWSSFEGPGQPMFDSYLVNQYAKAVDTFSAHGARVVWMTAPCIQAQTTPGQADPFAGTNTANIGVLDHELLPKLVAKRPSVKLFDLDAALCPGGKYRTSIDGVSPIRSDGVHFSVDGSLWFADTYGRKLLALGVR